MALELLKFHSELSGTRRILHLPHRQTSRSLRQVCFVMKQADGVPKTSQTFDRPKLRPRGVLA